jgi:rSAM/selenodomain-associated transferase 1
MILKSPRVGEVKTRLANDVGAERATIIYRALVEHQAAQIPSDMEVVVYFTPADAKEEMKNWLKPHLRENARFLSQVSGDLGDRLAMVVDSEFARGNERLFLIGGDCPGLCLDYFRDADLGLDTNDVVIGPAQDGGYVLLGLKSPLDKLEAGRLDKPLDGLEAGPYANLFKNIAWSSGTVLSQTLDAARKENLSVRLLHPLVDIDDIVSLNDQSELIQNLLEKGKRARTG